LVVDVDGPTFECDLTGFVPEGLITIEGPFDLSRESDVGRDGRNRRTRRHMASKTTGAGLALPPVPVAGALREEPTLKSASSPICSGRWNDLPVGWARAPARAFFATSSRDEVSHHSGQDAFAAGERFLTVPTTGTPRTSHRPGTRAKPTQ
jgi:hypothetical protein